MTGEDNHKPLVCLANKACLANVAKWYNPQESVMTWCLYWGLLYFSKASTRSVWMGWWGDETQMSTECMCVCDVVLTSSLVVLTSNDKCGAWGLHIRCHAFCPQEMCQIFQLKSSESCSGATRICTHTYTSASLRTLGQFTSASLLIYKMKENMMTDHWDFAHFVYTDSGGRNLTPNFIIYQLLV